ncbi:putative toxin-antitoxin system toxin component, PIN family [Candidatus Nitrosotenuis chungbukensis]|uniref:putative toxin-antitoxin system toxin component, PIN family n=1 Tax=Candidatus Nitrosotenuis chungbukensis TaxID=1353246 RepID=UPI0012FEAEA7|nr:putative toxin-antitoxin system toxin component, PIN family [Candidatus Nitrosotenuis chungbukensis]
MLDTNVIVSAIIHNGKPRKLLQLGINGKYQILTSRETLEEVSEVLQRPKFKTTGEDIAHIISALVASSENVSIRSHFQVITDDPDDNIIINTAYDGNADYIVSGDRDLLNLENFRTIKIITIDEMLKLAS